MANLIELTTSIPNWVSTTIKIDDLTYPLVNVAALNYGEIAMMQHAQKFMVEFGKKTELLEDSEYEKGSQLVLRVLMKVIDCPAEILKKLSFDQQLEVMNAWNKEMGSKGEEETSPLSENSEKSSPSSSASTAGRRSPG